LPPPNTDFPEGGRLAFLPPPPAGTERLFLLEAWLPEEARGWFSARLMAARPDLDPFPTGNGVGMLMRPEAPGLASGPWEEALRLAADELKTLRKPGFPFPRLRLSWLPGGVPRRFLVGDRPFLLGPLRILPAAPTPAGEPPPPASEPEGCSPAPPDRAGGGGAAGPPDARQAVPDSRGGGGEQLSAGPAAPPDGGTGAPAAGPAADGGGARNAPGRSLPAGPALALPGSLALSPRRRLELSLAVSLMAERLSPPPGAPDTRGGETLVLAEGPAVLPLASLKLGTGPVTFLCTGEEAARSVPVLAALNGETGRIRILPGPLAKTLRPGRTLPAEGYGLVAACLPPALLARHVSALARLLAPRGRIVAAGPAQGAQTAHVLKAASRAGLLLGGSVIEEGAAAICLDRPPSRRFIAWDWKPGDWLASLSEDDLSTLAELEAADGTASPEEEGGDGALGGPPPFPGTDAVGLGGGAAPGGPGEADGTSRRDLSGPGSPEATPPPGAGLPVRQGARMPEGAPGPGGAAPAGQGGVPPAPRKRGRPRKIRSSADAGTDAAGAAPGQERPAGPVREIR
jgi:hypothetical protein